MATTTDDPASPAGSVALLIDFANTVDAELGTDALTRPAELRSWLAGHGLVGPRARVTTDDVALARLLRDGLRESFDAHHHGETGSRLLDDAAARLPLLLSCPTSKPCLEPASGGVKGALTRLLIAVNETVADGTWTRLKVCPADDCRVAFYDPSKNRSKTWCSMEVCGNRAKTRGYRSRRKAAAG